MSEFAPIALQRIDSLTGSDTVRTYYAAVELDPKLAGLAVLMSSDGLCEFTEHHLGLGASTVTMNYNDRDWSDAISDGTAQKQLRPMVDMHERWGIKFGNPQARVSALALRMGEAGLFQYLVDINGGDTIGAINSFRQAGMIEKASVFALSVLEAMHSNVAGTRVIGLSDRIRSDVKTQEISDREQLVKSLINDRTALHAVTGKFEGKSNDRYRCAGFKSGAAFSVWGPGLRNSKDSSISYFTESVVQEVQDNEYRRAKPIPPPHINTLLTDLEPFSAIPLKIDVRKEKQVVYAIKFKDPNSKNTQPDVYTEYSVRLPKDSASIALIEADPSLLVDMMRTAFPKADRSTEDQPLRLANQQIVDLSR